MVYVSKGCKELKRVYPHEVGLVAKTTKQTGKVMNLVPRESNVSRKEKQGLK